jgi:uncharacterized membrane protein (DUF2068 family)
VSEGGQGQGRFVRLIAAERAVRGLILVAAGIYLLDHTGADFGKIANHLARAFNLNPQRPFIRHTVDSLGRLRSHQVAVFGGVGVGYGVLELVEGVGLWLEQRWAEWLTVIATGLLIPFELYEVVHKASLLKAGGLAVNIAIVVYLFRVVRRKGGRARARTASAA